MELQKELLQQRRKTQLAERRAQRGNGVQSSEKAVKATSLKELERVTSRPGFLTQQLKTQLTPLRRWYVQLKLLIAQEEEEGKESALTNDKRCYDVVYKEGMRVTDARESLLDEGVPMDIKELLCFSIRSNSITCRVSCLNVGPSVVFTCSESIPNLQDLQHLLPQSVTCALSFLHSNLQSTSSVSKASSP